MSNRKLAELKQRATAAIKRYYLDDDPDQLRVAADNIVRAREFFVAKDGGPDWRGTTYAYRQWNREVMTDGGVQPANRSSMQARIRYHAGGVLRQLLSDEEIAELGLQPASPRQKSGQRRAHNLGVLRIVEGGARLSTPDDILAGLRVCANVLARVDVAEMANHDRYRVEDARQLIDGLVEDLDDGMSE